ncbi:DUF4845 domain-containing protein [uncultured Thiocystis sp.]|jgi:hypothetical protein|uniref:DUF4845 domain-containing protein n=1 Tax=uncultured Thiocystis sp. TaxID=1202134 RepID=UPI0026002AD7|nr:DUF4845 domain-containing protein [uncultured Thiocystis sp.]
MRHLDTRRWQQRGMGLMGLLVTINLVAFFLTLLLKLGPLYVQFWTVRSIMHDVAASSATLPSGPRGLHESLAKRLNINSITGIDAKNFKIAKQDKATYRIDFASERRVHLFYNIDAVVVLTHHVIAKTH